jgi:hypothetical protein
VGCGALASAGLPCDRERDAFNVLAGTSIQDTIFFHFSGACTAEAFVRDLLAREHVRDFVGLDEEDILELLRSISTGARADEVSFWLEVLELNLPEAPISDLIFHPNDALRALGLGDVKDGNLAAEDILRIARSIPPRAAVAVGPSSHDGSSG